jgi:hypothetical protein
MHPHGMEKTQMHPHGMYTLTVWKVFDLCGEENEADKQRQKCLSD